MTDETRPSQETRKAERAEARAAADAGRAPTPDEEEAAERAERPDDELRQNYEEMRERGANQEGEGRLP